MNNPLVRGYQLVYNTKRFSEANMISEPHMKREVAVSFYSKETYLIQFFGTADAASDFSRFGFIKDYDDNKYGLDVDQRYDFDEVLAYIQNYGGTT